MLPAEGSVSDGRRGDPRPPPLLGYSGLDLPLHPQLCAGACWGLSRAARLGLLGGRPCSWGRGGLALGRLLMPGRVVMMGCSQHFPKPGRLCFFLKCPNELSEKIIGIAHSRHFIKFQRLCPFFNFAFSSTFLSSQFLF